MFKPGVYTVEYMYRLVCKMQNGLNHIDLAKMVCITLFSFSHKGNASSSRTEFWSDMLAVYLQGMLIYTYQSARTRCTPFLDT